MPNGQLFSSFSSSIFSPSYWRQAASELKSTHMIAFSALVIALQIVVSSLFIPVGDNLRIYFSFFVKALGCAICGPVMSLITGFAADILGFVLFPSGVFFFGYTVSAMVGALIYALFFYRRVITLPRIILCKLCINVFVNIGLGSVWSAILYSKGFYFYFVQSLIKNVVMFPIEVAVLFIFLKVMMPAAARVGLVSKEQSTVYLWRKKA